MKKLLIGTLILSVLTGCSQVNTGEVGIKTTFGKVVGSIEPGMYFYMPGVSNIQILNTKVQTIEGDSAASSKDLQTIQTKITLNYHLGLQDPVSHYTRLGADQTNIENSIVKPAMSESFKSIVARFTAEELIIKREIVSQLIIATLAEKLKQYDLFVDSLSVTQFEFSLAYATAIEAKQVAEQNASKAKNDLQRIQVEAQQKVAEAEGQTKAMALQRQVVSPELIQLKQLEIQSKMIDKWDGHYPSTYLGNNPMNLLLNKGM